MKRARMLVLAGAALALSIPSYASAENVFEKPSPLPFHAPQFDKIKDSDYRPALEEGMRRQLAEAGKIANNPAPATFGNTIVAMEKSGRMLNRVANVFFAVVQANTNDTLQKVQAIEAPKFAALNDSIYLNAKLFARVKKVYDGRARLKGPEQQQLVKVVYDEFLHAGAMLSGKDKARIREINKQLSMLETKFEQKLLAATKDGALVVSDKSKLAGLGADAIAAAARDARMRKLKGKWVIALQNTTQQPALAHLTDRAVRKELFERSWTRTEKGGKNDTRDVIAAMAKLRAEKAKLMGYPSFAAYKLENQMAKTPDAVLKFMAQLIPPTRAEAAKEAKELQAMIDKEKKPFKLEPWDWGLYAERLRKAKYDVSDEEVKPYFELDSVLKNGLFYAANKLYGLTFRERHDIPVYQKDVRVFDVFDKDGSELGLFYIDYFKRDGAWMSNFVGQSKLLGTKPVIYNVANFTKPAPGKPALLTYGEVKTMFHEFGHALHGFFADEIYPTISGTNVARDFVEFPSQFNEHWALYPDVLKHYARHYKTGKPMPAALAARLKKAARFDQGYALGELLAAAELDMQWHTLPASAPKQNVDKFETAALKRAGVDIPDVPPRYRSSYFAHIWANDYAAGYYAYLWTEMLDDDAFHWFTAHGGLTRANGERFRKLILSRGHTEDYDKMFRAFYGKDPDIGPMLEDRGLVPETN